MKYLGLAISVILCCALPPAAGSARRLAIVGADLVDVRHGRLVTDALIVVSGDRIVYAGKSAADQVPARIAVFRADGKIVIPGLIDLHVHLNPAQIAPLLLAAGVTTARELGSPEEPLRSLRKKIDRGSAAGPRIIAFAPVSSQRHSPFAFSPQNAEEVKSFLKLLPKRQFQGVKIFDVPPGTLPFLVAESRKDGMMTSAHVDRISPRVVIECGVDTIEHIAFLVSDLLPPQIDARERTRRLVRIWRDLELDSPAIRDLIQEMKRRNTALVPALAALEATLYPDRLADLQPDFSKLPAAMQQSIRAYLSDSPFTSGWQQSDYENATSAFTNILTLTHRLHQQGIPVLAGSDNLIPGFGIHRELELLVAAGFTPAEALQAATWKAALTLKEDASVGSVEVGKLADFLILSGNPLADIRQTRRIELIMKGGQIYHPPRLVRDAERM